MVDYILYKDKNALVSERIKDLLSKMTIEEKARQLDMFNGSKLCDKTVKSSVSHNTAAPDAHYIAELMDKEIGYLGAGSIHDLYPTPSLANEFQRYAMEQTRLQIPFILIEEGLHGFCKNGSTVFPGQLSVAATFEPKIAYKTGRAIATEFRACGVHKTLGPTMDLVREPRWGRVEESYGEDTYLSASMAREMVLGLQGDGIHHNNTVVAEPKHFTAHGIPEGGLNCAPAHMGLRELFTNVLPIFEAAIKDGGAYNVMCSYNSIDGIPCVSSKGMMTGILRERFGMRGFVLTDLGAINRLQHNHHTAHSAEDAILKSLEAGSDMQFYDYPHAVHFNAIINGVNTGRISEEVLDIAVGRVLRVKFELGLFENPYIDETLYGKVTRSKEHNAIALESAEKSMCLLKNNGILPLKKEFKRIAIVGPHADDCYFGRYTPLTDSMYKITALEGFKRAVSNNTEILYDSSADSNHVALKLIPDDWFSDLDRKPGLLVGYYLTGAFEGEPVGTGHDTNINAQFIATTPHGSLPSHNYGIRWEGFITPDKDIDSELVFAGNESAAVYLNDENVLFCIGGRRNSRRYFHASLKAGVKYKLKVDVIKDMNGADITLGFKEQLENSFVKAIELAKQSDVVIAMMGDVAGTCGEGYDRSELTLPGQQREMLKALKTAGKPIVLVLQNGRPIELSWESVSMDAILEAFCPGEEAGTAIAKVLLGAISPAGRLPVSFPATIGSIPCNYNTPRGKSGQYIENIPPALYPFGYGLSYTSFVYSDLEIEPLNDHYSQVKISLNVKNTGSMDADEVIQLYICDEISSTVRPSIELKGFTRRFIKQGETAHIEFSLFENELKVLDEKYRFVVEAGEFKVMIGAASNDIRLNGSFYVKNEVVLETIDIQSVI
jgi:beta-glucosidase